MLVLEWNNPKITISELDLFLGNYLGAKYDGLYLEGSRLNLITKDVISAEEEDYIKNWFYFLNDKTIAVEVKNTPDVLISRRNDHTLQPWGAKKGRFTSSDKACQITLSNRSEDGLTFTYDLGQSVLSLRVGDYIFQDDFCNRAWIVSIDEQNNQLTLDDETVRSPLNNGTAIYSQGHYLDVDVPDWFAPMYLWGISMRFLWSNDHAGKDDFVELSVVDQNDFFKNDDFCQALFGVTAQDAAPILEATGWDYNGEYGHWTKYYDETWVVNANGKNTMTPDGAPGELLPHLTVRLSYFTSRTDNTINDFYVDYFATAKI